jgi:hypothetical protein
LGARNYIAQKLRRVSVLAGYRPLPNTLMQNVSETSFGK